MFCDLSASFISNDTHERYIVRYVRQGLSQQADALPYPFGRRQRSLGMSLTLYFHPLSSFCWKALIGLYELDVPFEKRIVDLANDAERAAFLRLWPIGKFPVLGESETNATVPESTILLEYVDRRFGAGRLIPKDPARALECRLRDRI